MAVVHQRRTKSRGSLTIVGTGIRAISHITLEALTYIRGADKVFHVLTDPLIEDYILRQNPASESLKHLYVEGGERLTTYRAMQREILEAVRSGLHVCAVFYGHPGVFVTPSHEAIRQAQKEGYEAQMLPGVSAEDCLFADLGFDPAEWGCQSFEATHFLVHRKKYDPSSALVLWQVGAIADPLHSPQKKNTKGLTILKRVLCEAYPASHTVVLYEAAILPGVHPTINPISLDRLDERPLSGLVTLYVPPMVETADPAMLEELGLDLKAIEQS